MMNIKYLIIPIIALGCILSGFIYIEYYSNGDEWLPTYFASPFVYKTSSPVTSLEYHYSVGGLVGNVIVWSFLLFLMDKGIKKLVDLEKFKGLYQITIISLVLFSLLQVVIDSFFIGSGFGEFTNYWYWDIDEIAMEWHTHYQKDFQFFGM